MGKNEEIRIHLKESLQEHQKQIQENLAHWQKKPVLRQIYRDFHADIAGWLSGRAGETVELGSGIGNIREAIPHAVRTDLFPNPWIDRTEDVYGLSMADSSCANLILFDVFHHLEFPMDALDECRRVLQPGGRLIVFDHAMSAAGYLFSRFLHHEKAGFARPYVLRRNPSGLRSSAGYYADHANADRILVQRFAELLAPHWKQITAKPMPALAWVASGGYRGPCLIPSAASHGLKFVESCLETFPGLFALRLLVVLEKI